MIELYNADCLEFMRLNDLPENVCIVTDPPFNIGYHYNQYNDRMREKDYLKFLADVFKNYPCVIVHYPEMMYRLSAEMGRFPNRVVSWVYNSNTARQHRDIAFFDVVPDFRKVKQPYKNPTDKRIQKRIAEGKGARLYDWWEVNQVKNVSKSRGGLTHPCVMPLEVMKRVIGILSEDYLIFDPFAGSGTTAIACKELGRDFIGTELNQVYFEEALRRLDDVRGRSETL